MSLANNRVTIDGCLNAALALESRKQALFRTMTLEKSDTTRISFLKPLKLRASGLLGSKTRTSYTTSKLLGDFGNVPLKSGPTNDNE